MTAYKYVFFYTFLTTLQTLAGPSEGSAFNPHPGSNQPASSPFHSTLTPSPITATKTKGKRRNLLPGVRRCSPPILGGESECVGLSTGGRRLHLCGDGVLGFPGSGLHLLRFGDWGLRRASNSIDRFKVAPQAMFVKQNDKKKSSLGEKNAHKAGVLGSKVFAEQSWLSWAALPPHNNGFSSLNGKPRPEPVCSIFKTSQWQIVPCGKMGVL